MSNVNHIGYDERITVAKQILASLSLNVASIDPIAYSPTGRFHYNNFLYKITFTQPHSLTPLEISESEAVKSTTPLNPTTNAILRLCNPLASGLSHTPTRIQNIVAAHILVNRSLLRRNLPPLAPAVYAYGHDKGGFAWSLDEYKRGVDLDTVFSTLSREDKREATAQVANLVAAVQQAVVGVSAGERVCGLTFDENGEILEDGEMTVLPAGPFNGVREYWDALFREQLSDADKSLVLDGWKRNGIRARIERFLSGGVGAVLENVDLEKRVLVHRDFTANNILYDPETKEITALLDFDFSAIMHPSHEFFSGFRDFGGNVSSSSAFLRKAICSGIFTPIPAVDLTDAEKEEWELASIWDSQLAATDAVRPSMIKGIEQLEELNRFSELLFPWAFGDGAALFTEDKLVVKRDEAETNLINILLKFGF
ncbi:hypothetical protein HK100_009290 [Physocladia obscura]|uniref:Aminoglycoside phosphotransferase domain-containing protein n=1 Tax=Physocladia obscura TaxID=109957 RepID=A0AAD5XHQ1_9FUNG|nr:hypothetical protein HK100_009290 [Physocladia obscura]